MTAKQSGFTLVEATMEFCSERAWQAFAVARDACVTAGLRPGSLIGAVPGTNWHRNRIFLANYAKAREVLREEIARMISTRKLEVSAIEQSDDQDKQRRAIPFDLLKVAKLNFQDNSLTADGRKFVEIQVRGQHRATSYRKERSPTKPDTELIQQNADVGGRPRKNWPAYAEELDRYTEHEGKRAFSKKIPNHLFEWGLTHLPKPEQAQQSSITKKLPDLYAMARSKSHF